MGDNSGIKHLLPKSNSKFRQGYYTLKNPGKYLNLGEKIIYRSSYEYTFCTICDTSPSIIKWQSEPFSIRYYDPVQQKNRSYYPDYLIITQNSEGILDKIVVEIKPNTFINKPKMPAKITSKSIKNYNFNLAIYVTNMAKMQAMHKFCAERNMRYVFATETFLNRFK